MTLDEAVRRYQPFTPELALMETWTSGGTISGGLVATHSTDLPPVYGFIHRLHPDYVGPLFPGCMVLYPRYAYETIETGNDWDDVAGKQVPWALTIIKIEDIECIIPLEMLQLNS